jgi:hypothetical protein
MKRYYGWVNVKDELPIVQENRENVKVIVCFWDEGVADVNGVYPDGYNGEVTDATYSSRFGFRGYLISPDGNCFLEEYPEDVTHWMYYPEPPNRKGE